mmetsp:Transcript_44794/g.74753  ORF Transcript_44794/g.74753 Transcript_44794/m.74753 type:complete len:235 (-) Transcript_44794:113-817(-)|eukprot:CAMPEP_0198201094 /NCGR_PEP_ID=MMETSP1445-20131203/3903_1 /TAXON_ID=36898 /ORGANISM="Pyramimonas sp., Strain CCMP2087" /LENGTH=234 /DNA_ID=CAMNT_0043871287 /DNA_START=272 /DNA_END=979 /DNA_ORIENTATION=+
MSAKSSLKGQPGFAPSKSTVYVANLDYGLTNNDLNTIFSVAGHVGKVSVVKNRDGEWERQSKGLAFVLYMKREDAVKAVQMFDGKVLNGRKLKVILAEDNGRASEFIKRREYPDKSRCYECGEEGHLSYTCPRNALGARDRPQSEKKRPRKAQESSSRPHHDAKFARPGKGPKEDDQEEEEDDDHALLNDNQDDWGSAVASGAAQQNNNNIPRKFGLKGPKKSKGYFSDESGSE